MVKSAASAGSGEAERAVASASTPWRASEVPDSRVHRTAAIGCRERGHRNQLRLHDRCDHHLRHALAAPDRERRIAMIDQEDVDLAAIIRIHRARRIQDGHAMLGGKPGTRPYLRFIS